MQTTWIDEVPLMWGCLAKYTRVTIASSCEDLNSCLTSVYYSQQTVSGMGFVPATAAAQV